MDGSIEGVGRGRIADEQEKKEAPAGGARAREKGGKRETARQRGLCSFVVPPPSSHSVSRTQPAARWQLHQPINQPWSVGTQTERDGGERTIEVSIEKTRPVCAEQTGSTCRYGTETHSNEHQQQRIKTWSHSHGAWLVGWLVALMMTMVGGGFCAISQRRASARRDRTDEIIGISRGHPSRASVPGAARTSVVVHHATPWSWVGDGG